MDDQRKEEFRSSLNPVLVRRLRDFKEEGETNIKKDYIDEEVYKALKIKDFNTATEMVVNSVQNNKLLCAGLTWRKAVTIMTPDTQRGVRNQDGFHISLSHHLPRVCESKERCHASHIHQPEGKVTSYASNSFNRNPETSPEPRHHNPVEGGHMLKEPQLL